MTDKPLAMEFHREILETIRTCIRECRPYNPRDFTQMVQTIGAVQAAKALLARGDLSTGFTELWSHQRLDLTVEAKALMPQYRPLFTSEELATARRRLLDHEYAGPEVAEEMVDPAMAPPQARAGSQRHLQVLVNHQPDLLSCLLLSASPSLRAFAVSHPAWVSPLARDDFREYRDGAFLQRLGLEQFTSELRDFWPAGGPRWDALATVEGPGGVKGVLLVEAKAHAQELLSSGSGAGEPAYGQIERTLESVKGLMAAKPAADWLGPHYQSANRLAHLFFLNAIARVPAWLVSLCFVGDEQMGGPQSVAGWQQALDGVGEALGLPGHHLLHERMITIFAPVPKG